jgi:hypothetical protein
MFRKLTLGLKDTNLLSKGMSPRPSWVKSTVMLGWVVVQGITAVSYYNIKNFHFKSKIFHQNMNRFSWKYLQKQGDEILIILIYFKQISKQIFFK